MINGIDHVLFFFGLLFFAPSGDLVDLIKPQEYFQARDIEVSMEKMAAIAARKPRNAKMEVAQLFALRYLGDKNVAIRKSEHCTKYKKLLRKIAAGKTAQDSLGFAREYAQAALARLEGRNPPQEAMTPLKDSLSWFPSDLCFAAAGDRNLAHIRKEFFVFKTPTGGMLMKSEQQKLIKLLEKIGNVRLHRFAVAAPTATFPDFGLARISGKLHHERVRAYLQQMQPKVRMRKKRLADGTSFTSFEDHRAEFGFGLVGNTDIAVVISQVQPPQSDSAANETPRKKPKADVNKRRGQINDLMLQMLKARSNKMQHRLQGKLGKLLNQVPANSAFFCATAFPSDFLQEKANSSNKEKEKGPPIGKNPPQQVLAYAQANPDAIKVRVRCMFGNAADAGQFATGVRMYGNLMKQYILDAAVKKNPKWKNMDKSEIDKAFAPLANCVSMVQKSTTVDMRFHTPTNSAIVLSIQRDNKGHNGHERFLLGVGWRRAKKNGSSD